MRRLLQLCLMIPCLLIAATPRVELGVDLFFKEGRVDALKNKRVGLVTNQTGIDSSFRSTVDLFLDAAPAVTLAALFTPEHGLKGSGYAFESIGHGKGPGGIPIYSLHGETRRPTDEMLKGIDVLVFDIQDIGCRSYTYTTTLFYVMEEAAKRKIPVIVLDRPNPINGITVDGPMLEESWRSFIGYINVPYCHGLTIGELARYFNATYKIGCNLSVVPMRGWQRWMCFSDTGLPWIPTSPHIPEPDTPLFYATTGIIGELGIVNIGVGYTLPFKVVGAPWIQAEEFAEALNEQKLPGVRFVPTHYRPFYGAHKGKDCQGVIITVTDPKLFRPVTIQYMLIGILKNLYPKQLLSKLNGVEAGKKNLFCKANGNEVMFSLIRDEKYVAWKLILFQKEDRESFRQERKKFLLY
ncbi:MAG: DUF1343 domain-containing protein [Verrucomicrobia bacterium]|nr:DUF1343 domain-containing protein [Verrucomicrobiota bacterium]